MLLLSFLVSAALSEPPDPAILNLLNSLNLSEFIPLFSDPTQSPFPTDILFEIAKNITDLSVSEPLFNFLMERGHLDAQFHFASLIAPSNQTRAADLWQSAADLGHRESQFRYAAAAWSGRGAPQSVYAAVHYFNLSMQQGHLEAQTHLAALMQAGVGMIQNKTEAARLFKDAADRGEIMAQYHFGVACLHGNGVRKNFSQATKYLEEAMERGHQDARYTYATMLIQGVGVQQDVRRGVEYLRGLAEVGHVRSQIEYAYSCLTDQNYTAAAQWFKAAMDQGRLDAGVLYANLLAAGAGVPQNLTEAARIFKEAADEDGDRGQIEYGLALWRGQGVERNLTEAARYFRAAGEGGIFWGEWYLGQILEEPGELQNYSEAARLYETAAEKGCDPAKASLGNLLIRGLGVQTNLTRGVALLREALRKKSVDAMLLLGKIAEEGLLGIPDVVQAFERFEQAANQSAEEEQRYPVLPDTRGKDEMERILREKKDEIAKIRKEVEAGEKAATEAMKRLIAAAQKRDEHTEL
jgi:TPR repeat protein